MNKNPAFVVSALGACCCVLAVGGVIILRKLFGSRETIFSIPTGDKKDVSLDTSAASSPLPAAPVVPHRIDRVDTSSSTTATAEIHETLPHPSRDHTLQLFQELKSRANNAFQRGQHVEALQLYQDAIDVVDALGSRDREAVMHRHTVSANVVLVYLKLEAFEQARMLATFLLQEQGDALTALIRTAQHQQQQSVAVTGNEAALAPQKDVPGSIGSGVPMPSDLVPKVLYRRSLAMKALGDARGALGDLRAAQLLLKEKKDNTIEDEIKKLETQLARSSAW